MASLIEQLENEVAAISAAASRLHPDRPRPRIAVINATSVLSDAEVASHVAAFQIQVDRDYEAFWDRGALLSFVPRGKAPPASMWWLVYGDTTDQLNALGYHDETTAGQPQGKVFVKTTQQFGLLPSVTGSHELLEIIGDPRVKEIAGVYSSPSGQGRIYANEMCDPVEADVLGYMINGVTVSDFILPDFWEPGSPGPWDFASHLKGPLTLAAGGYQSYMDVASAAGWQQWTDGTPELATARGFATALNPRTVAQPGSRRERRQRRARDNVRVRGGFAGWVRSTVLTADE